MIATNGVTARYLSSKKFPSIRRVVRTPKRWERIVEIAGDHGVKLPEDPDSTALEEFLIKEKAADPLRFPDLSISVINFWELVNTLRNFLERLPQDTLVSLSGTIPIPQPLIVAIPI